MADQNPFPPVKPFASPPVAPQPPIPVAPPRPITPPAGIPVKETNLSNLSPSPAPHLPPSPPSGSSPSPGVPRPVPPPPAPPSFRSSIRTMEQDLGKTPTASARSPVSLPLPSKAPAPASINIPPPDSSPGGHKTIWVVVGLFVLAMAVVAFLLFRGSDEDATPTPSETASPTPSPLGFDDIFISAGTLEGDLETAISGQSLATGEIKILSYNSAPVVFPQDVANNIDQGRQYITLFGKPDGSIGRGIAVRITDREQAQSALTTWESTMARDLKTFFQLNTQRSASDGFLGNTYQNILIRYRNFPDALSSVDYAMVGVPNGDTYLLFTNTRDHMFSMIDRIMGFVLGK